MAAGLEAETSLRNWTKRFALFSVALGVASLVALLVCVGSFLWWVEYGMPKRNRYLIPDGYAGWLCISYNVPGAAALPMEDGFRLVQFPPSGVIKTSSEFLPGGGYKDESFYYSGTTRRPVPSEQRGGGYTTTEIATPQFTNQFWISRDAKADYPIYVEGKPDTCGPFAEYPRAGRS
jgi:hypothetical protein